MDSDRGGVAILGHSHNTTRIKQTRVKTCIQKVGMICHVLLISQGPPHRVIQMRSKSLDLSWARMVVELLVG